MGGSVLDGAVMGMPWGGEGVPVRLVEGEAPILLR